MSSSQTIKSFLLNHIAVLAQRYDVTVVANVEDFGFLAPFGRTVSHARVPIHRDISPLRDIAALVRLFVLLRAGNFDAVYSVTPKAGLLSTLSAYAAGVQVRIHTFTGQVWVTARGPARAVLRATDRVTAVLATHVLVDSHSQMEFLVAEGIVEREKAHVLAKGSISGVDVSRFVPNPLVRIDARRRLGIPESAVVFLFVGRLKRDKGILDLANAFAELSRARDGVHLVVVGPDEEALSGPLREICRDCSDRVAIMGATDRPEDFMAAADVLCLPSYREGFGGVIVEAAAAGITSIGSRIYGITDAIEEGITGLLHSPADVETLLPLMLRMVDEPMLRQELGAKARARATRDFSSERVSAALLEFLSPLV